MSPTFESAVEEIFNKFDVSQTGILTYALFKAFCDSVGHEMAEPIFSKYLSQFTSTKL